jgi:hypothetical protein
MTEKVSVFVRFQLHQRWLDICAFKRPRSNGSFRTTMALRNRSPWYLFSDIEAVTGFTVPNSDY